MSTSSSDKQAKAVVAFHVIETRQILGLKPRDQVAILQVNTIKKELT